MPLLRLVNIAGARHNLLSPGKEFGMQLSFALIVHRSAFSAAAPTRSQRLRRKTACFLMCGRLPEPKRVRNCRSWYGYMAAHSFSVVAPSTTFPDHSSPERVLFW